MGGNSDSDEGEPSAPPPDSPRGHGYDDEFYAPQWVQRLYGPPPGAPPPGMPEPTAIFVEQPLVPVPGGAYVFHPGTTAYQPAPIEVHAFPPGLVALPPGGAVLRARSPANPAGNRQARTDAKDQENVDKNPAAQQNAGDSPVKPPAGGANIDLEAGRGRPSNRNFGDPTKPSRRIALLERRKKQLRTFDKDSFGVPLPKTRRPFSVFASPLSVAEVCTGLGVYLASLQAAVILAFLLSLVCIYPLVNNIKSQRWADEYSLLTGVRSMKYFLSFTLPILTLTFHEIYLSCSLLLPTLT